MQMLKLAGWVLVGVVLCTAPVRPGRAAEAMAVDGMVERTETLELRGVVGTAQQWRLGVRDVANHQSVWLAVGDTYRDCVVRGYDPTTECVTIERGGALIYLTMGGMRAEDGASGAAEATPAAGATSGAAKDVMAESRRFGIERSGRGAGR